MMPPQLLRLDELCATGPPAYPEIDVTRLAEQGQAYVWQRNLSAASRESGIDRNARPMTASLRVSK